MKDRIKCKFMSIGAKAEVRNAWVPRITWDQLFPSKAAKTAKRSSKRKKAA